MFDYGSIAYFQNIGQGARLFFAEQETEWKTGRIRFVDGRAPGALEQGAERPPGTRNAPSGTAAHLPPRPCHGILLAFVVVTVGGGVPIRRADQKG